MFKVAIVGGENMGNYPFFERKCVNCLKNKAKTEGVTIYTTGDAFVTHFAEKCGLATRTFYTDWKRFGHDALKARNDEMLSDCDAIIVFDDGIKDTRMILKMATDKGLPSRLILSESQVAHK